MENAKRQLLLDQTARKLAQFKGLDILIIPPKGWIHTIRTTLNMSLRQLGSRLNITAQSVKEIEDREAGGTITLNSLSDTARALDMKLVYGFVPKHETLEAMVEKRAFEIAQQIVLRTNTTMALEDQQNSEERIRKAIAQKTIEIMSEMPKYLWD